MSSRVGAMEPDPPSPSSGNAGPPDGARTARDGFDDENAGGPPAESRPAPDGARNANRPARRRRRRCRCRCRAPFGGNREALGWALDGMARSVSFMGAAVFGGTALLRLAKEAAGCETEAAPGGGTDLDVPDCDGRVYGIRPSSLLTTVSTVVALVSAALLPLVGSVVDHTPHRLLVGRVSAVAVVALLFPFIFLSEDTWFAMGVLVLVAAFAGWIHTCVAFAYLPEVTDDEDELMRLTASFTILQYSSTVGYIVAMIGVIYALGLADDSVASNRVAQSASVAFALCAFGCSWWGLFGERPAFREVPGGSTLLTAGFENVRRTGVRIWRRHAALKWFLVAVSLSDAGAQSLASIALTFVTDQLHFSSAENGAAVLVLLVGTVPGCVLSKAITRRFDPVRGAAACLLLLAAVTAAAAAFLTGPDRKPLAFACAAAWGVGTGWKYSSERFLVCRIIPGGRDAELMGMYLFAGQVLVWLPALVFTAMNEAGVSMRVGIGTVGVFFLLGVAGYCMVGDYGEAVRAGKAAEVLDSLGRGEVLSNADQINEDLSAVDEVRIRDENEERTTLEQGCDGDQAGSEASTAPEQVDC